MIRIFTPFRVGYVTTRHSSILYVSATMGAKKATMPVSASKPPVVIDGEVSSRDEIRSSLLRLSNWLEENDYQAYDPFDGLNARVLRPFTFESNLLRTVLQQ